MKKILLLLLISTVLSGCGRDYEDMLDEMHDELCNVYSLDFIELIELGEEKMEATLVRLEELRKEAENEIESLPRDEMLEAYMAMYNVALQGEQMQSGDLSSCDWLPDWLSEIKAFFL